MSKRGEETWKRGEDNKQRKRRAYTKEPWYVRCHDVVNANLVPRVKRMRIELSFSRLFCRFVYTEEGVIQFSFLPFICFLAVRYLYIIICFFTFSPYFVILCFAKSGEQKKINWYCPQSINRTPFDINDTKSRWSHWILLQTVTKSNICQVLYCN